jgi:sulfur carrier protein ThiS
MMQVSVTMWGNLRRFAPRGVGSTVVQLPDNATVEDLTTLIGAQHEVYAASVNGKVVSLSSPLSPSDRVFLFDHLHGG